MIKTLIIEDELPAARRLEKLLKEVEPQIRILDRLESVEASIEWFREHPDPDLLMLDIQLADGQSFDIFRHVSVESFVVFTTAYDEYAIRAFELNSIAYLQKPVDRNRLKQSIEKYKKLKGSDYLTEIRPVLEKLQSLEKSYKQLFIVHVGDAIKMVRTGEIACFFSMAKSTFIATFRGQHYGIDQTLDKLEQVLDPELFFRINRQYIIHFEAIERIRTLSRSRISLRLVSQEKELLVSTARTREFRQWLDR